MKPDAISRLGEHIVSVDQIPPSEDWRLRAVAAYGLSSDVMQGDLEPLNLLARALFGVPTSMVSVVSHHHTFFASRVGISVCEVDRHISFCHSTIARDEPLVILDASQDSNFYDNPLVTGPAHVRFYAGAPLIGPSGAAIGSFCLLDTRPRKAFTPEDVANLKLLATLALDKMELRRLARAQQASDNRFRQMSDTSPAGIICADHEGIICFWNQGAEAMLGFSAAEAEGQSIDFIVPHRLRGSHGGGLKHVAAGGKPKLVGQSVELWALCKDGSELPIELALSMWQDEGGASFGAIIRDLSGRRANEERLDRLAHRDHLTALPNRLVLRQRLDEVTRAQVDATLLVLDLDGFKQVNDTLGHSAGDRLLQDVAGRLLSATGPLDTVARLGGDEFAVILSEHDVDQGAGTVAERLIQLLSAPFTVDGLAFNLSASVGVAHYPSHGKQTDDLLSAADLALYAAKAGGRQRHCIYSPRFREAALQQHALESELRHAYENGEFRLFYQPQIDGDGRLMGAEALLRWDHPERGLQSPAAFLSFLEKSPLAIQVGQWVLQTACAQAAIWRQDAPGFRIGVNLFGLQLHNGNLAAKVRAVLEQTGLPAANLELEVTENIILQQNDVALRMLRTLYADGVSIAFDDFGTGFASLSLLKRYPLSRLKIDQSFVRNLGQSREDAAIVRSIVHMAKAFGLGVIAEGVETVEQQERLLAKGCDELQGYLHGHPMPALSFASQFGLADRLVCEIAA
ncbi:EAL domain-containing protein [Methylobacterium aquaticum]|nr:EAL domain-containing protein [Methylobacterium aquaticum]